MWGGTVGGPIVKNKLFTFFSYEKWKATQPSAGTRTLPTDLERVGDFSQSKNAVGGLRTIFDPWTTKFDPVTSTATRTPFPANIIPPSRIDPSAKIVMGDIWKPNGPGDDITGINNYKIKVKEVKEGYVFDSSTVPRRACFPRAVLQRVSPGGTRKHLRHCH